MKARNITMILVLALLGFGFSIGTGVKTGTTVGDQAPELSLKGLNGETIKLSDLKGKIVLVDFWASWCGPCRRENPNVIRAYKKYQKAKFHRAEGFEVLSVSLDKNKEAWEAAVKKDGLFWDYHVSDLKGWSSEAAGLYNVSSIPTSFLIDENGIILAKNLRGMGIDKAVDAHVKKFK
jgi:thiol-disulfide isomerase/thioredoxin